MRKFASLIILLAASLHGQTICSYIGTSACANTLMTYTSGTAQLPVKLLYNGYNPGTLPAPAQYVTYQQGAAPNVTTPYQTTFTSVAGSTGIPVAMCDDLCTVTLNGTVIGKTTAAQYNQPVQLNSNAPTFLVTGTNTLVISNQNTGGNTGVSFYWNIVPPATGTVVYFAPSCYGLITGTGAQTIVTIPPGCKMTTTPPAVTP